MLLRHTAIGLLRVTVQMSPVKIDGAKRQLFSLAKSQNVKLQEATLKRRKSPSPPSNAADAQAAAAAAAGAEEPAAAEPAEADPAGEEEEQQAAAGAAQKHKALKKEKSGSEEAVDGEVKARPIKRKRKDEADVKVCSGCMAPY